MRTTVFAIAGAAILVTAVAAAPNRTPGRDGGVRTFGAYAANLWEFGAPEIAIFQEIVVGHQHYRQGPIYVDRDDDGNPDGAGMMNFFAFCSDCAADVMFLSTHGRQAATTLVEKYPIGGRAARDSSYAWLRTIFPANEVIRVDYADGTYGIEVTQPFYTSYFQTRQAMAWWSHCYSSLLDLSGPAEARVQLGYDGAVSVGKCKCDERTILRRMDGQSGIPLRPLRAAAAGVNATCPDGGTNLVIRGADNTTLSPAVLAEDPHGIVCTTTPGFIQFDTALDTSVDPASAMVALCDADLVAHRWTGDDRIDFTVVPNVPDPHIAYCAKQTLLASEANRSHLDGNTDPNGSDGLGPNEDNYLWFTTCPSPAMPVRVGYPAGPPTRAARSGRTTTIPVTVTNSGGTPVTVTSTASDRRGWVDGMPGTVTVQPGSGQVIYHNIAVPNGVWPGTADTVSVSVDTPEGVQLTECIFAVASWFDAWWWEQPVPAPGQLLAATVVIDNESGDAVTVDAATLLIPGAGPAVWTAGATVPAETGVELAFVIPLPPELPAGIPLEPVLTVTVGGVDVPHELPAILAGLPLQALDTAAIDVAPGCPLARVVARIVNRGSQPVEVTYTALDVSGWPAIASGPPLVSPGEIVEVVTQLELPEDASLVGGDGLVILSANGLGPHAGLVREFPLAYRVEPVVALLGDPARPLVFSDWTGSSAPRLLPVHFDLRSRLARALEVTAAVESEQYEPEPPYQSVTIPPLGTTPVDFVVEIPPDAPLGTFAGELSLDTFDGLGDQTVPLMFEVTSPVVVDFEVKGIGGVSGDTVSFEARVRNQRADAPMAGEFSWEQDQPWFDLPPLAPFAAAPFETIHFAVGGRLPPGRAVIDSNRVVAVVSMVYDTGTLVTVSDELWIQIVSGESSAVEGPSLGTATLDRVAPNPFNPTTTIHYRLDRDTRVDLAVYDLRGRRLVTLHRGWTVAGMHAANWTGVAEDGSRLGSGVYLVRLGTDDRVLSAKVTLVK
ncbi:MAG TPA: T9SS type A sorting domain-containing protein [Candidatus Krumholzibacteria bacterium]|nr:T9SS type A sorting domain-containing protein [Candidatus Krumholzibacteria bacterium]HPD70647.1 T9SS type A sorting domain-containing protein [Candidatus Krumholzibacteria bacterium]HRY39653.1 T9SS type A sorting domain-containing protein [Candidatus Krumholzibacteria bacterium]